MSGAVIGFDTATPSLTVAVARGADVLREAEVGPDEAGRPRASSRLLREIAACADAAGGWKEVGLIAVGLGPGSYTGLRIGIATARALAQARGLAVAGVPTTAALAAGIAERHSGRSALAVLDARRGQLFAELHGAGGEELWPPGVAEPDELAERVRKLDPAPIAAGDGSLRFREQLEAAGASVPAPGDSVHRVAARHVCALGAKAEPGTPEQIAPIYLRAPDADRWIDRDSPDRG